MSVRRAAPLLALLGCAGTSSAPTTPPPSPSAVAIPAASAAPSATEPPAPPSDPRVAKALKKMARVRALAADRPVPGVTLARAAMIAKVRAHVEREIPKDAILREGQDLILTDAIPPATDYLATTFALLEEELAGFYAPEDGAMYLAEDLKDDLAAATLNHELVHALQDQHFALGGRMKYTEGASDRASATSALAEGDATSAMFDAMLPVGTVLDLPRGQMEETMLASMDGKGGNIPPLLRVGLVSPYTYGLSFVNTLRRQGGWAAVDAAWKRPPTTTEQILHVEKYLAGEGALSVPAPTFATLTGATRVNGESVGELGLRLLAYGWLGAPSPSGPLDRAVAPAAEAVFRGWGGAESVFVTLPSGAVATAYRVVFDGDRPTGAKAAFDTLAPAIGRRGAVSAQKSGGRAFRCVERPETGPLAIAHSKGRFYVFAGPALPGAPGAPWKAAGDCALVAKWLAENEP